jgi:hypothetical protein
MKSVLWILAGVFAYLAWKSGDLHEKSGDFAYLREAIGWGIVSIALVAVNLFVKVGGKQKTKARAGAGSGW